MEHRIKVKPYEEKTKEIEEEIEEEVREEGEEVQTDMDEEVRKKYISELFARLSSKMHSASGLAAINDLFGVKFNDLPFEVKEKLLDNYAVEERDGELRFICSLTQEGLVELLRRHSPYGELLKELSYEEVMELRDVNQCYNTLRLREARVWGMEELPFAFKGNDRIVAACIIDVFLHPTPPHRIHRNHSTILTLKLLRDVYQRLGGMSFRHILEMAKKVKYLVEKYQESRY